MAEEVEGGVSKPAAVAACAAMAIFYVAVLHAPTVVLCLSPPTSFKQFTLRRFLCAAVSTAASFALSALLLPMRSWSSPDLFGAYGIRGDHLWQAVLYPLFLTSLMYAGSLVRKFLLLMNMWEEYKIHEGNFSFHNIGSLKEKFICYFSSISSNILAWRNYVVAPITEELVFRACMIPLLLCGGCNLYNIIFFSPFFFSLAHLSHLFEFYGQPNYTFLGAFKIVGIQLGYTVVFGSYASFLFIRTGHILAPLVAHIFCNIMGLPLLFSRNNGIVAVSFVAGILAFAWLLVPLTTPDLYNYRTNNCSCWHAHCTEGFKTRIS